MKREALLFLAYLVCIAIILATIPPALHYGMRWIDYWLVYTH